MAGLDLWLYMSQLHLEGVKQCLPQEAYELDSNRGSHLQDYVDTLDVYKDEIDTDPDYRDRAAKIFVELAIRWIDPHNKIYITSHIRPTAMDSAKSSEDKLPDWLIPVLSFYEKYYDAKSNGVADPQIAPGTTNVTALDIIKEFKSRAHEIPFDKDRQKLRYASSVPTQATAPMTPIPNPTLTHPLITVGPHRRRRHQDSDVGSTGVGNGFGAAFISNRI